MQRAARTDHSQGGIHMTGTYKITPEDVEEWGKGGLASNLAFHWLADILNGDYSAQEAREDCLSIINPQQRKPAP
jgi:hypothetical protein